MHTLSTGPVASDDMKAFIAMIPNMGIILLSDLKDYWATNDTMNLPFFGLCSPGIDFFRYLMLSTSAMFTVPPSMGRCSPSLTGLVHLSAFTLD